MFLGKRREAAVDSASLNYLWIAIPIFFLTTGHIDVSVKF
jgi:hypothetical protein